MGQPSLIFFLCTGALQPEGKIALTQGTGISLNQAKPTGMVMTFPASKFLPSGYVKRKKKQCHSFNIYREHIMYSGTVHGLEGRQKCKTQPSLEDACQEGHDNCDRP